jgi:hypothetical protein
MVARKVLGSNSRLFLTVTTGFMEIDYKSGGLPEVSHSAQYFARK